MTGSRITQFIAAVTLALVAIIGLERPASADFSIDLPAGIACDFSLRLVSVGEGVPKEFTDKNGNVVRTLLAGKGAALTFTNLDTGETLSLKANGSVLREIHHPDGTRTAFSTGHTILILFPGDEPPGPSTTLHIGRVVYTVAPGEVFTVQQVSGRTIDICAALS